MAAKKTVPDNQYDERRETLVVEIKTTWPSDIQLSEQERQRIAAQLHREPKDCKKLEYIRCPTGLVRHITVTTEDIDRLKGAATAG